MLPSLRCPFASPYPDARKERVRAARHVDLHTFAFGEIRDVIHGHSSCVSEALPATEAKPHLLFFFDPTDGRARRVDGYLAQALQRRRNHETFTIFRVDVRARPDLIRRFEIERTPSICVVDQRRIALRAYQPRGAAEIEWLLEPWLR